MPNPKLTVEEILKLLDDPKAIGQAEYWAVYDCITEALDDDEDDHDDIAAHAETMCEEIAGWAKAVKEKIEAARRKKVEAVVRDIDRDNCVSILQGQADIQCRDDEDVATLREALIVNVLDGTVQLF